MNGSAPRIEIFKPFGEAFELTKKILFQPFDLKKWCVIGFAAFLANLSGGFRFNFGDWNRSSRSQAWSSAAESWHHAFGDIDSWVVALIIAAILVVVLVVAVVFAWLGARGRLMFVDCIVKNRGAIAEPWREYRKEGNSLFLFSLLVGLAFILVTVLLSLPVVLLLIKEGQLHFPEGPIMISAVVFVGLIFFLLALFWVLVAHLMVPVMYRRRCHAGQAFHAVLSLIALHPGEIALYCLFLFVLFIGVIFISCFATCATCCLAAIPYVGTVILLPLFVLLRSFSLMFLRQFGSDYDVWAGAVTGLETVPPIQIPSTPPPLQP